MSYSILQSSAVRGSCEYYLSYVFFSQAIGNVFKSFTGSTFFSPTYSVYFIVFHDPVFFFIVVVKLVL